ncbi:MAG: hypothetical protein ICV74_03200 [Thermoleophilia bacterium]|nr:hypothetical protein [Thermoleophilia bacterium]
MRTEHERAHPAVERLPEPDPEGELDFGVLARTVARRWWLVAAAVALAAFLGYVSSLGGDKLYEARTTLYLGQPLSPTGGSQIASLGTNPATVNEIVQSDEVVADVARRVGVRVAALREGISTRTVQAPAQSVRQGQNPLVEISVRGPWPRATARAADLLAARVIREISGYVDVKIRSLRELLASQNRELQALGRRLDALQRAASRPGLSGVERLSVLNLIGFAEQRRGQLVQERSDTRQLVTLAETSEKSAQLDEPRARRVPGPSPTSAIAIGALIGLLVGTALALLWDPLLARRPARSPA